MRRLLLLLLLLLLLSPLALAIERFPPPEFDTGHALPQIAATPPRALSLEYLDVGVLALLLALGTWCAYGRRSRRELVLMGIFSVVYFGFWRKGCVCSIGSIQNVAQAVADPGFAIPLGVTAFFMLPLLVALFAGRTFCSAACPHGALQDVVLLRPVQVPRWLDHSLGLIPYMYLGLAVAMAVMGGSYIICRYDPLVPIFRFSGTLPMVSFGVGVLLVGVFVGRPYCRYICPYGALLAMASSVSKWRIRITPDECTQCRLCEDSCPFGAIDLPPMGRPAGGRRSLALSIVALPLLVALGAWVGGGPGARLARQHPTVRLAEELHLSAAADKGTSSDAVRAFRGTGRAPDEVYVEALRVRAGFVATGRWSGGWIGLVVAAKLIALAAGRRNHDYEANRAGCVACGRCYLACPSEHQRLQRLGRPPAVPLPVALPAAGAEVAHED